MFSILRHRFLSPNLFLACLHLLLPVLHLHSTGASVSAGHHSLRPRLQSQVARVAGTLGFRRSHCPAGVLLHVLFFLWPFARVRRM